MTTATKRLHEPVIEVTLNDGRRISAVEVHIRSTYEGALEVLQDAGSLKQVNDSLLAEPSLPAEKLWGEHLDPVMLGKGSYRDIGNQPLPSYRFTALFESDAIEGPAGSISQLVVTWFQDDLLPMLSEGNEEQLKEVPWDDLATETEP